MEQRKTVIRVMEKQIRLNMIMSKGKTMQWGQSKKREQPDLEELGRGGEALEQPIP